MQSAHGELEDSHIIVKNTEDIGRLYSKSRLGKTTSENHLKLSLIEAAYLLDDQKLTVHRNKQKISFPLLVSYAAALDVGFETKFIIFQSLRNRGQQVTLCKNSSIISFEQTKKEENGHEQHIGVIALSERNQPNLFQIKEIILQTRSKYDEIWIALADEEGDVTYYLAAHQQLQGCIPHHDYPKLIGVLLKDRALLFDETNVESLHSKEFYGKFFGNGLQLSLVEAAYLIQQDILTLTIPHKEEPLSNHDFLKEVTHYQPDLPLRLEIFRDLKRRNMLVKTGFKFGTHFRAYTQPPDKNHAEYLVHAITDEYNGSWAEISRAVRLAHSVNKTFAFALFDKTNEDIFYLSIRRLRP